MITQAQRDHQSRISDCLDDARQSLPPDDYRALLTGVLHAIFNQLDIRPNWAERAERKHSRGVFL